MLGISMSGLLGISLLVFRFVVLNRWFCTALVVFAAGCFVFSWGLIFPGDVPLGYLDYCF